MKYVIAIVSISFLFGCDHAPSKPEEIVFKIPFLIQDSPNDTFKLFKVNFMPDAWPKFVKKSRFVDTLSLSYDIKDSIPQSDFLYENYYDALDTFGLDGFEVYADYNSSFPKLMYSQAVFKNCYFPVYLVNQTPNTKLLLGKDDYIFAIQEAQDGEGYWRPIEHVGFDFCGNGHWAIKVHKDEFVTILFPKYEGSFKTKMRVRIENRSIIYVSNPFDGFVNANQFFLDSTDDNWLKKRVIKNPRAIQDMFYGSIPFELADITLNQ